MRRMTMRQALTCETATGPRCRCRCGGLLHGKTRQVDLEALPEEDPHHALWPKRRESAEARRRREQEDAGQEWLWS